MATHSYLPLASKPRSKVSQYYKGLTLKIFANAKTHLTVTCGMATPTLCLRITHGAVTESGVSPGTFLVLETSSWPKLVFSKDL